jgi:hypothetical protein
MKMKNKKGSKKLVVIGIIVVIAFAVGGAVFLWMRSSEKPANNSDDNTFGKVNYDPPTDEDKAYNDRIKEQLGNESQDQNNDPNTKKNVSVTVVDASQYGSAVEVRAFIPGITESGGECTFTFTNGTNQVVRKSAAHAEAQTTPCANLSVDKSTFSPTGAWSLVVSYSSSSSSGKSDVKTVEVH